MGTFSRELIFFIKSIWHGLKNAETEALLFLLAIVLGVGTVFYSQIEGWVFLDSFYFSVMTLTTVGYGDLVPSTPISKIFTMGYVFVGLLLVLVFINSVIRQSIEDHSLESLKKDRKFVKELKKTE